METIINAINLLKAVRSTMDTIDVRGIDNQDKFVGCANAILTVSQTLEIFVQESAVKETAPSVSDANGTPPNEGMDNINTQEEANGR